MRREGYGDSLLILELVTLGNGSSSSDGNEGKLSLLLAADVGDIEMAMNRLKSGVLRFPINVGLMNVGRGTAAMLLLLLLLLVSVLILLLVEGDV